jgi:D-alanyl-D-alanine carboxypeptidase
MSQTPGASIAIVRDDRIAYVKGYGYRDLARRLPVDTNTIFRFGSMTKQFVAGAALLLAQDGRLRLDTPIARWYPKATGARAIELEDLLALQAGYRDYYPLDYVDNEMAKRVATDAIVREYGEAPLTAPPRTRFEYSNTEYTMAGGIVAKVAHEPLQTLLETRIFAPLHMTRTAWDEPLRPVADRATGYDSYFTELQHHDAFEAPNWLNSAAALAGNASDVARWDIALLRGSLLHANSVRRMTTGHILMPGNVHTSYGLGFFATARNGHRVFGHGGNVIGFASANEVAPDDRTAVVVLTNSYEAPAGDIARALLIELVPALAPPTLARPAASASPGARATTPAPSAREQHAVATIRRWLRWLATGQEPRAQMTADFRALMDPVNVARARNGLAGLGSVRTVAYEGSSPRGGLVVSSASVRFAHGNASAVLYETPAGKVAEIMLFR